MLSLCVFVQLRVRVEFEERFLVATRLFSVKARRHPEVRRIDFFKRSDVACTFVFQVTCTSERALESFMTAPTTSAWLQSIEGFLDAPISMRRVMPLSPEPLPPIVRPPPLPVLETTRFGRSTPNVAALLLPRLQIVLERVEIARTRETSLLAGTADPCIVVGCFTIDRSLFTETLIGRAIYRLKPAEQMPHAVVVGERLLDLPFQMEDLPRRVSLVLLAFEENGGSDVRTAYQALGEPEMLLAWTSREQEPNPLRIGQHAATLSDGKPIHFVCDGKPFADSTDDTWVGASLVVVELQNKHDERVVRCHTRSSDAGNDYFAELSLRLA